MRFYPFGIEGGVIDLIVLVPDHFLSYYFGLLLFCQVVFRGFLVCSLPKATYAPEEDLNQSS